MVKIRLTRLGDKKTPFYRVVVTDSRKARDGEYIEKLGTFNPLTQPAEIKIDEELTKKWQVPTDKPVILYGSLAKALSRRIFHSTGT